MTKTFRFGVQLPHAASKKTWIERVRRAEQLGYDVIALPDHIGDQLAPFPALVSAAEATERARLGTFVLGNDFRHPLIVAHEAATVDLLTEGRLELGMGAGWSGQDYERLGIEFSAPRTRYERLTEAVTIIESYFGGETFSFEGRHYSVKHVQPAPTARRSLHPPFVIGGGGRRILEFAAQHADIVSIFLTSLRDGSGFDVKEMRSSAYQRKVDDVRRAAGERAEALELNVLLQHFEITDHRNAVAEEHARESQTTREDLLALPFELIGTLDQITHDLLERRERYGISYITVFDQHMEDFAPVIEELSGK